MQVSDASRVALGRDRSRQGSKLLLGNDRLSLAIEEPALGELCEYLRTKTLPTKLAINQSINQPTIHYLFTAKMKGVIFESAGGPLKVVDLPVPEPSPDQILVKSLYTAINPVYVKGFLTSLTLWDLGRSICCIQRTFVAHIVSRLRFRYVVEVVQYSSYPHPDLPREQGGGLYFTLYLSFQNSCTGQVWAYHSDGITVQYVVFSRSSTNISPEILSSVAQASSSRMASLSASASTPLVLSSKSAKRQAANSKSAMKSAAAHVLARVATTRRKSSS